jgi:hypothetical protein
MAGSLDLTTRQMQCQTVGMLDLLISGGTVVDDHVIEPAGVWQDRLPKKYAEIGPRVVRTKIAEMTFVGGKFDYRAAEEGEDGTYCDRPVCRPQSAYPAKR